jgi:hypothetical protein
MTNITMKIIPVLTVGIGAGASVGTLVDCEVGFCVGAFVGGSVFNTKQRSK